MDPMDLVRRLSAIPRRGACTDAERRAARLLAAELKRMGRRDARLQTVWVRPSWALTHALIAAVAIVGSVLAVHHAAVGLGLTAGALVAYALDLSGRLPLVRRLTYERATQNVVSRSEREDAAVRLIVTAATDTPRRGIAARLPWVLPMTGIALAALTACAGARLGGEDARWLGAVQLVPTIVLLLGLAALLDQAVADPAERGENANASAAAVALAVVAALDRRPPRALAVDVVLAGAGEAHALGLRRHLARLRRQGTRSTEVAVLHVAASGAGHPVWWAGDGIVLPLRLHPQLVRLAAQTAEQERHLQATAVNGWGTASGARAARAIRWPAIAVGASEPRADMASPEAMDAVLQLALGIVARLDAEVAAGR